MFRSPKKNIDMGRNFYYIMGNSIKINKLIN